MLIRIAKTIYVEDTKIASVVKMRAQDGRHKFHVHLDTGVCYPIEIDPQRVSNVALSEVYKLLKKLWKESLSEDLRSGGNMLRDEIIRMRDEGSQADETVLKG